MVTSALTHYTLHKTPDYKNPKGFLSYFVILHITFESPSFSNMIQNGRECEYRAQGFYGFLSVALNVPLWKPLCRYESKERLTLK